jgi:hypothetical protein
MWIAQSFALAWGLHWGRGMKTLLLVVTLVDFLALHVYAFSKEGIAGFMRLFESPNAWDFVLWADLSIALTITAVWLVRDARRRGVNGWPYIGAMVLTGSVSTLSYLLKNPSPRD